MDRQKELGIVNYGVTMTTLEDVFLKLEGNEMIDEKGSILFQITYFLVVIPCYSRENMSLRPYLLLASNRRGSLPSNTSPIL